MKIRSLTVKTFRPFCSDTDGHFARTHINPSSEWVTRLAMSEKFFSGHEALWAGLRPIKNLVEYSMHNAIDPVNSWHVFDISSV